MKVFKLAKEAGIALQEAMDLLNKGGLAVEMPTQDLSEDEVELALSILNKDEDIISEGEIGLTAEAEEKTLEEIKAGEKELDEVLEMMEKKILGDETDIPGVILYQNKKNVKGLSSKPQGLSNNEIWSMDELEVINELMKDEVLGEYLRSMIYDKNLDVVEELKDFKDIVNHKRAVLVNNTYIVIPRQDRYTKNIDALHLSMLNLALNWYDLYHMMNSNLFTKKEKMRRIETIKYQVRSLKMRTIAPLISKNFKELYQFRFPGVTGVALTGNVSIDGCMIPRQYSNKKVEIGDYVMIVRHPYQNLAVCARVEGFTNDDTVRVHSAVFEWLGGDFDGDKSQFVPLKTMYKVNKKFFRESYEEFENKMLAQLPSLMLRRGKGAYAKCNLDSDVNGVRTITVEEMLAESKKSAKFYDKVEVQDYIDNQRQTVLNMRTVKDGTAKAGWFCNDFLEIVKLCGEDISEARAICDIVQQAALDSKHDSVSGEGFEASAWSKIIDIYVDYNKYDHEYQAKRIKKALDSEVE